MVLPSNEDKNHQKPQKTGFFLCFCGTIEKSCIFADLKK